jgi:transcriptional regulator with XRE-family HTH domain
MPVVATAKPDGPKIRQLISERGFTVTDFARRIGRARQSIWNITGSELPVSITFMRQIARGLGVKVSDISDWTGDDDTESEPEMRVPA